MRFHKTICRQIWLNKKILLLVIIPACLLVGTLTSTMIDPATRIKWPSCLGGQAYAPATNTCFTPTGTLPAASGHRQLVMVDPSNVGTALTEQDSMINAVFNEGIDNNFATDVSAAIAAVITGLPGTYPPYIYLPAGHYKINSGILIPCTLSTCNAISIIGAGADSTILETNCSGSSYGLWYNNTTNSGDNLQGMRVEHLQIKGTGGGACQDGLRLTQTARNIINDVKITGFSGNTYATGTISTSGSTVTGTGTAFTSAMVPGVLQVAGVMVEVCTYNSGTSLSLCDTGFPGGNVAGGTSYAVAYGGRAFTCDPGFSYTQYISIHDSYLTGNMFGIYSMGSTNGGCSRLSVDGKSNYIAPNPGGRITNSVGVWLGKHSDTWDINIPINNETRCWVLDSAHANKISGECEDNSNWAAVTTCNGGVGAQSCVFGAEISADLGSTGYGNSFVSPYVYFAGTAFKVDNPNGSTNLSISGLRGASFANTNSYSFNGTLGCPLFGSGVQANISDWDCVYSPLLSTGGIANVTITTNTTSVPAGDCLPAKAGAGTSQAMTGLASTSVLSWVPNSDVVNVSGFGPGGALYLILVPGSGSFTWRECNANLAAAITPGSSVTWNVSAQ